MSHKALNWAFETKMDDAPAKSVLVALANHADKDSWRAYPAVETMMRHTAQSDRTIQRALKRLVSWGAVTPNYRKGMVTIYTLNREWRGHQTPDTVTEDNPRHADAPSECHPRQRDAEPPSESARTPVTVTDEPYRTSSNLVVVEGARARERIVELIEGVFPDLESDMAFVSLTASLGVIGSWIGDGANLERDILPTIRLGCERLKARGRGPPRTLNYFRDAVANAKATNEQGLPDGQALSPSYHAEQSGHRNGWAALATSQFRKGGKPDAL